jgi:hypothetical protein
VRIRAGVAEKLTLSPRPCGTLEIKARNAATGARFTLSADGVVLRSGALPQASPIILPVGQYEFNAQRPSCRDFRSTIAITHVGKTPLTFIFDCETASPPGTP